MNDPASWHTPTRARLARTGLAVPLQAIRLPAAVAMEAGPCSPPLPPTLTARRYGPELGMRLAGPCRPTVSQVARRQHGGGSPGSVLLCGCVCSLLRLAGRLRIALQQGRVEGVGGRGRRCLRPQTTNPAGSCRQRATCARPLHHRAQKAAHTFCRMRSALRSAAAFLSASCSSLGGSVRLRKNRRPLQHTAGREGMSW